MEQVERLNCPKPIISSLDASLIIRTIFHPVCLLGDIPLNHTLQQNLGVILALKQHQDIQCVFLMIYHFHFPSITISSRVLQLFYNHSSSQDIICALQIQPTEFHYKVDVDISYTLPMHSRFFELIPPTNYSFRTRFCITLAPPPCNSYFQSDSLIIIQLKGQLKLARKNRINIRIRNSQSIKKKKKRNPETFKHRMKLHHIQSKSISNFNPTKAIKES